MQIVLNSCAPWGSWAREERPSGYPLTPGMRVVTRVEALLDRLRISVPYGSLFTYDFKFRPLARNGGIWRTNEIWVNGPLTQKVVVGKVSILHEFFLIAFIHVISS